MIIRKHRCRVKMIFLDETRDGTIWNCHWSGKISNFRMICSQYPDRIYTCLLVAYISSTYYLVSLQEPLTFDSFSCHKCSKQNDLCTMPCSAHWKLKREKNITIISYLIINKSYSWLLHFNKKSMGRGDRNIYGPAMFRDSYFQYFNCCFFFTNQWLTAEIPSNN